MNGNNCARRTCWGEVGVGMFLDALPYAGTGFGHVALLEAAPAFDVFEPPVGACRIPPNPCWYFCCRFSTTATAAMGTLVESPTVALCIYCGWW